MSTAEFEQMRVVSLSIRVARILQLVEMVHTSCHTLTLLTLPRAIQSSGAALLRTGNPSVVLRVQSINPGRTRGRGSSKSTSWSVQGATLPLELGVAVDTQACSCRPSSTYDVSHSQSAWQQFVVQGCAASLGSHAPSAAAGPRGASTRLARSSNAPGSPHSPSAALSARATSAAKLAGKVASHLVVLALAAACTMA